MNIVIENLYGLICIPFVLFFLWWSIRKQVGMVLAKGFIISRVIICSLLIGALCSISIQVAGRNVATVFLLDVSDSMRDFREEGVQFIQEALEELPRNHQASVIVFGVDSQMDKFLDTSKSYNKISAMPISSATNIEQALQSALAYLPEEANKEIILLSDGQENEGDMLKVTELMKNAQVDFKVYKVGHESHSEVYIDELSVPETIYKGESFSVTSKIISNVATKAKLTLFSGTEKKSEQWVDLEVGENTFVFKDIQTVGGFKNYKISISADEDYEVSNNEYTCFTTVEDAPQVLLIQGEVGDGVGIELTLKQTGGNYKVTLPEGAPTSLEEMIAYQGIVLSDVFIGDLPEGFLNHIQTYVKSYGGGLVVTGGDDSYALGGYEGTVLEEILPVDMHKKGQMQMPDVSLCLVIDQSGSMNENMGGSSKLGLALQASAAVVEYLEEKDEISVISFDDSYQKVIERQKVVDKEAIQSLIYGIEVNGGTSIYPALSAAFETQLESDAAIKHIILLTDGQDRFSMGQYSGLLEEIQANQITVSTVAVGQGANNQLLDYIADIGLGRAYIADQSSNLPHIFAKEFFLSSGEYLVNETFEPAITNQHEVLQGIMEEESFLLDGYIGTSMKPLATMVLASHESEPVLAVWQYGLGKAVAWTSDVSGGWTSSLFETPKGAQLFKNILNWSMTTYEGQGEVHLKEEGGGVRITLTSKEIEEGKKVKAHYQTLSGEQQEVELAETMPGTFETYIDLEEDGFYAFNVTESKGDENIGSYVTAFAKQYSKEYKFSQQEGGLMQLIEAVEGKIITLPNEAFKVDTKKSYKTLELTNILLILAFMLFFIDILLRRFNLRFSMISHMTRGFLNQNIKETLGQDTKENLKEGTKHLNSDRKLLRKKSLSGEQDLKTTQNTTIAQNIESHKKQTLDNKHKNEEKIINQNTNKKKEQSQKQTTKKTSSNTLDTTALLKSKQERHKDF